MAWHTEFDEAWGVVKMPIVPGSVYRDYRKERERRPLRNAKLYSGKFDDPVTGEQLDMEGDFRPEGPLFDNELIVSIKGPHGGDRAFANFSAFPRFADRFLESANTETHDEFQRRGYATALYDLAAYLADRQRPSMEIMPSDDQTSGAKALWASRLGDLGDDEPRNWPVRGDLG